MSMTPWKRNSIICMVIVFMVVYAIGGITILANLPVALHNIDAAHNLDRVKLLTGHTLHEANTDGSYGSEELWMENYELLWAIFYWGLVFIIVSMGITGLCLYEYMCFIDKEGKKYGRRSTGRKRTT